MTSLIYSQILLLKSTFSTFYPFTAYSTNTFKNNNPFTYPFTTFYQCQTS